MDNVGAARAKTWMLFLEETLTGMCSALKGNEKFFNLNPKGIERGFAFIHNGG